MLVPLGKRARKRRGVGLYGLRRSCCVVGRFFISGTIVPRPVARPRRATVTLSNNVNGEIYGRRARRRLDLSCAWAASLVSNNSKTTIARIGSVRAINKLDQLAGHLSNLLWLGERCRSCGSHRLRSAPGEPRRRVILEMAPRLSDALIRGDRRRQHS
jgi:hypothetical protein